MRRFTMAGCLVMSSATLSNELQGTWLSDKEKTLEWNKAYTVLSSEKLETLGYMLGNLFNHVSESTICVGMLSHQYPSRGELLQVDRWENEMSYRIIGQNSHGYVIETQRPADPDLADFEEQFPLTHLVMVTFENENSIYFTALLDSPTNMPAFREYFKRVPTHEYEPCSVPSVEDR